jgi:exodeoxyribonuclease VII small subunit
MAETPKFEESLEQLEKLVEELEGGELDLDEALKRFEKGVALSKQLNGALDAANRKVEKLLIGADGRAHTEPLDGEEEDAPASKKPKSKKGKVPQEGGKAGQEGLF